MIKKFLFYGLIGWCAEIIWTGSNSLVNGDLRLMGFTNLWMFFIYGCAVFFEPLHDLIYRWKWVWRGLFWLCVIWGVELIAGSVLVSLLGVFPWHYDEPLAVANGLITLRFAPVWFMAGLLFERIHIILDEYEAKFKNFVK